MILFQLEIQKMLKIVDVNRSQTEVQALPHGGRKGPGAGLCFGLFAMAFRGDNLLRLRPAVLCH